jgi:hypothetical protein
MSRETHFLTLNLDSKMAVERMLDRLSADGLRVMCSFDLQAARSVHVDCTCPHHGKDECDCQLVFLLVYEDQGSPLTLVAHGKDNKTRFALVDPPDGEQERILKNKIARALALEAFTILQREHVK